jgi:hypothetical protein
MRHTCRAGIYCGVDYRRCVADNRPSNDKRSGILPVLRCYFLRILKRSAAVITMSIHPMAIMTHAHGGDVATGADGSDSAGGVISVGPAVVCGAGPVVKLNVALDSL